MEIANESIFVSSIRSFCKVFFACVGLFFAFFVAMIIYSIFSSPYSPVDKTTLNVLPNLDGETEMVSFSSPVILRINIDGVIGVPHVLDTTTVENILLDSRSGILGKDRVKAVLLHLNTPGGGVVDSDNIYRMLKAYKEKYKLPIYAYADKLYASPPSIIGSVGVVSGPYFNFVDAMGKVGVQSKTLTQGIDKDTMNPFRTWTQNEGVDLQILMASTYQRFVDIVTLAHPRLDRDKLVNEYGAQVFDGQTAQKYGYIDVADAEMNMALADLMAAANIDSKKPYQVVELAPKAHWLSSLNNQFGLLGGKVEHTFNLGNKCASLPHEPCAYYYDH